MKKKIEIILLIISGVLFISLSLIAYKGNYKYCYELTFLSNFICGIIFLVTGILKFYKKSIRKEIYLSCILVFLLVCLVSVFFRLNMKGLFIFLHIVNPIIALIIFFLFNDMSDIKAIYVLTIYIIPISYMIFAFIFGLTTNNYIYFFLNYHEYGLKNTLLFLIGALIGLGLIGYGLYYLNIFIYKKIKARI